jgi:hypothetical protein
VANNPYGGLGSVTEIDASTGALVRVLSSSEYKFDEPSAIAAVGDNLFVANKLPETMTSGTVTGSGSVTEIDASTSALVRVLSSSQYVFEEPGAMAVAGGDLFVASSGDSMTKLSVATGRLISVLWDPRYQFSGPVAMAVAGDNLFVANFYGESVTELPI